MAQRHRVKKLEVKYNDKGYTGFFSYGDSVRSFTHEDHVMHNENELDNETFFAQCDEELGKEIGFTSNLHKNSETVTLDWKRGIH